MRLTLSPPSPNMYTPLHVHAPLLIHVHSCMQLVALKFIPKLGRSQDELGRLRQEIEIMRSVRHPGVIDLQDWFETDNEVPLDYLLEGHMRTTDSLNCSKHMYLHWIIAHASQCSFSHKMFY